MLRNPTEQGRIGAVTLGGSELHSRPDDPGGVRAQGRNRRAVAVAATLAVGLALLLGGAAAVLARTGVKETGSNRVRIYRELDRLPRGATVCQANELVPAGTGAVRPYVYHASNGGGGERLRVAIRADGSGRVVAGGSHAADPGGEVTAVPVHQRIRRDLAASVCVTALAGAFIVGGEASEEGSASIAARAIGGDMRVVYLEPHARSWWSFLPTLVERMGAGRRLDGAAIALLVLLLSTAAIALAGAQLVRGSP